MITKTKPGVTLKGVIKFVFVAFNIGMLIFMMLYWSRVADLMNAAQSNMEQAGTNFGAMLGTTFIAMLWVIGDVILGIVVYVTKKS